MPKHYRNFPRKIIHQRPSWCVKISVLTGEEDDLYHEIFFGAFSGGEAKVKALPKIQRFLDAALWDCGSSPKVYVVLKKASKNGNGTPTYVLKAKYSWLNSLLAAESPSQVFKTQ